jgi:hypothetical protein
VEQKVSHAIEVPPEGDDFITSRVRDGYGLVMEFSARPFKICEECGSKVPLPVLEIAEVGCDFCNTASRINTHDKKLWFTGYFPLCDKLIEHLERTAPKRNGAWIAEMEAQNRRAALAPKRAFRNHAEAVAKDYWNQVAGNTVIGYGGGPASLGRL